MTLAWSPEVLKTVRETCRQTEQLSTRITQKPKPKPNLQISPTPPSHNSTTPSPQKGPVMTTLDLSNPQHVVQYLSATPWTAKSIVPLSGGYTNFAFRIELAKPYQGQERVVLKHSKSYIPLVEGFSFSTERQVRVLYCLDW